MSEGINEIQSAEQKHGVKDLYFIKAATAFFRSILVTGLAGIPGMFLIYPEVIKSFRSRKFNPEYFTPLAWTAAGIMLICYTTALILKKKNKGNAVLLYVYAVVSGVCFFPLVGAAFYMIGDIRPSPLLLTLTFYSFLLLHSGILALYARGQKKGFRGWLAGLLMTASTLPLIALYSRFIPGRKLGLQQMLLITAAGTASILYSYYWLRSLKKVLKKHKSGSYTRVALRMQLDIISFLLRIAFIVFIVMRGTIRFKFKRKRG